MKSLALTLSLLACIGGPALACLHGATGKEQTSVVHGNERVDRIRVEANAARIAKVFVADPDAKITGSVLTGEAATIHENLAQLAANIGAEGARGSAEKILFNGTNVSGKLIRLDANDFPDWAAVAKATGITSKGPDADKSYTKWLSTVRQAGRMPYALVADVDGGSSPLLAVHIAYPAGNDLATRIIKDKILETAISVRTPSITWFMGLSNADLDNDVTAAGAAPMGKADKPEHADFFVDYKGIGNARIRSRVWNGADKDGKSFERSGILWME